MKAKQLMKPQAPPTVEYFRVREPRSYLRTFKRFVITFLSIGAPALILFYLASLFDA